MTKLCPKTLEECNCPKGKCFAPEEEGTARCPTCGSSGFGPSVLGPARCEFCDGTEGGNPPTEEEIADVQPKPPLFPHCTAEFRCDEHFGDHWKVQRPVAWVIDLAQSALRLRLLSAKTRDDWQQVCENARVLKNLMNAQWRDCVRQQGLYRLSDKAKQAKVAPAKIAADYDNLFGEEEQ